MDFNREPLNSKYTTKGQEFSLESGCGVLCSSLCPWCGSIVENSWHVLVCCAKSEAVWHKVNLWNVISSNFEYVNDFKELFFIILVQLLIADRMS